MLSNCDIYNINIVIIILAFVVIIWKYNTYDRNSHVQTGDEEIFMDYIETIKVYIEEKHTDYAIMLSGDWGVGKTFFIKNVLVNQLKLDYPLNFIYISLFNVACLEDVYATIDYNMLNIKATNAAYDSQAKESNLHQNLLFDNTARASTIKSILSKGVTCLTNMINIPTGDMVNEVVKKAINESYKEINILPYSKDVVFIFDDFERTRIPKSVLLGLFDRLTEHNHSKVIVVCNESALLTTDNNSNNNTNIADNNKRNGNTNIYIDMDNIKEDLLNYKKYKEKVFEIKIEFKSDLNALYLPILDKLSKQDNRIEEVRDILFDYQPNVIGLFNVVECKNLRVLISFFKRFSEFVSLVKKYNNDFSEKYSDKNRAKNAFNDYIHNLILNFICSSINNKVMVNVIDFEGENRVFLYWNKNGYEKLGKNTNLARSICVYRAVENYIESYQYNNSLVIDDFNHMYRINNSDIKEAIDDVKDILLYDEDRAKKQLSLITEKIKNNQYNINAYPKIIDPIFFLDRILETNLLDEIFSYMKNNCKVKYDEYKNSDWNLIFEDNEDIRQKLNELKEIINNERQNARISNQISNVLNGENFVGNLRAFLYNGDGYYLSKKSHLAGITSEDLTAKIKLLDNEQLSSLRNLILNFYVDERENASKYYEDFKIIKDVYEEIGIWLQTDKHLDLMKRFHIFKLYNALKKAKEVLKSQQEVENNNEQGEPMV